MDALINMPCKADFRSTHLPDPAHQNACIHAISHPGMQLLKLLWEHERQGGIRYSIAVSGDHSTPVEFGDHSHEPVPFAIAHLRHIVSNELWAAVGLACIPTHGCAGPWACTSWLPLCVV